MARQRRDPEREAFWRGALKRFDGSGLSVRAFCQRERLTESAFYAWRRTIRQRDGAKPAKRSPPAPRFMPVRLGEVAPRVEASIAIEFAGRRVLRLPESTPIERLARARARAGSAR
jgi:transposase-like protein